MNGQTRSLKNQEPLMARSLIGQKMPRLLYLVNIPRFFVSHRLPLALAARDAGYEIHVAAGAADEDSIAAIQAAGLSFHPLPIVQHGISLWQELVALRAIYGLYRVVKPDIVHQITVKPILYGGIAAWWLKVPAVVNAVTGLGYVFVARSPKWLVIRAATKLAYRGVFSNPDSWTIFQNPDDRERLLGSCLIDPERTVVIKGSGVDMTEFRPQPEPDGVPVVLFAGRLLWQKGLGEFVEAARRSRDEGAAVRFVVAGYIEAGNPASVSIKELEKWQRTGLLEWWGNCADMPEIYSRSHVVCLPSSYGEGVPKVLIEAAACGRAIVTTNTPGCREIVCHGENGLCVPPNDTGAVYVAIKQLLEDPAGRQRMGARGREVAVREFSLERICGETLRLYKTALGGNASADSVGSDAVEGEEKPRVEAISGPEKTGVTMKALLHSEVPWWGKIAAKMLLARLPVRMETWHRLGLFVPGFMRDPDYAISVFEYHWRLAGAPPPGFTYLELGPGESLASAAVAWTFGAAGGALVDAGNFAVRDISAYAPLFARLKNMPRARDVSVLEKSASVDAMLTAVNARSSSHGLAGLRALASDSADVIFSQAVLEHVPLLEFAPTACELFRIQREQGVGTHRVDFKDHLQGSLHSLRFTGARWEQPWFASRSGFYTNRLRLSAMIKAFVDAGFAVEVAEQARWPSPPLARERMAAVFRELSDDDLCTSGAVLVLRKILA